ncbi:MAG TPA: efflux RND transporter periplasmic adaptor subunit [Acidobacteriota bacterium]|nr:efflux RND transporter periplasmic adaptor subunit [Acidobacteriota bacterium]
MSTRKKVYGFLLAAILVVVALGFGSHYLAPGSDALADSDNQTKVEGTEKAEQVTPVELSSVEVDAVSSFVSATANLRPLRQVEVVNRSDGQVLKVYVQEGAYVREGDLLVKFDDTQHQIRLATAQKQLAQARLQLEKAALRKAKAQTQIENSQEEYERYKKLYDEQLVSEREVAQLQYQIEEIEHDIKISSTDILELENRVEELGSEINQNKLEIERTEVKAPFGGRIVERMVEPGQTFSNLQPLVRLADLTPLYAEVYLSEREAMLVEPGQPATIVLGARKDSSVKGRVARIAPIVDQSTGTVKVTVEAHPSSSLFKPGAFVRVDIKTDTRQQAILVPKRSILEEDGQEFVYVVEDDKARRQEVETGYSSQGRVEILEGLEEGQKVVSAGQGALKDGAKVKVIES